MVIALDKQKSLFRDEAAYEAFIGVIRKALKSSEMPLVVSGNELLFAAVSRESAQRMLSERILKRLAESPDMLAELKDRLESDEVVE